MKIRKSVLLEALKVLGKVVAQTSPEEVVRSVRFVGDGGRLRLMATDGVECVAVSVEYEVAEAVDFAVEYRALRELIRSTRGGEVEVIGKQLEWPELEAVPEEAVKVELPATFGELLALAAPVTDRDGARLILRGVNLSPEGITATNGKELLHLPCPLAIPEEVTLPFPLALLTAKPAAPGVLHLWSRRNERLFRIEIGGFLWQGRALSGKFPAWKQVIPSGNALDYSLEFFEPERIIAFLKTVPDHEPFHGIELNVTPRGVTLVPVDTPEMSFETDAEFWGSGPGRCWCSTSTSCCGCCSSVTRSSAPIRTGGCRSWPRAAPVVTSQCRFTLVPNSTLKPTRRQTKWKRTKSKKPTSARSPQTKLPTRWRS